MAFHFAAPTQVVIKRGDTLSKVAARHDVTVEEIVGWNALETDVIEVEQVLLVWDSAPAVASLDGSSAGAALASTTPRAASPMPAAPRPAQSSWRAPLQRVFGGTPGPEPEPVEPAAEVSDPVQMASVGGGRRTLNVDRAMLKGSGILDADVGTDAGIDLARSAAGMRTHEGTVGGGGLGERSLGDAGTGETLELQARPDRDYGAKIPDKPIRAPRMSKPAAKRCLLGPSATMDDKGMVTNHGLDAHQINIGMGRIARYTMRCFPSGTEGTYQVNVEVKVGCNGLVDNVYTIGAGSVPGNVTQCIEQTLGYASFSAHSVPDGMSFQYPLKFSF